MTTPLLTPESVKNDSQRQEQEQRMRVRDLATEEDRLVRSINNMRSEEVSEKERIEKAMTEYRLEAKNERDRLSADIGSLEARRSEAMKPVEAVLAEAIQKRADAETLAADVAERDEKLKKDEKSLQDHKVDILEKLHDRVQLLDEREASLDKRENRIKAEEDQSKESAKGLAQRWVDFHIAVDAKNKELTDREVTLTTREAITLIKETEQAKTTKDQFERERRLVDGYATLESARKEILENEII